MIEISGKKKKVHQELLKEFFLENFVQAETLRKEKKEKELSCSWLGDERLRQSFQRGSLVELLGAEGSGKTELVVQFLVENSRLKTIWIEKEFSFYPYFLEQSGIDLNQICFIEAQNDWSWCLHQAFHSRAFDCLVISGVSGALSSIELRRLKLLAEKTGAILFFLSSKSYSSLASVLRLRFQVSRRNNGQIQVSKLLDLPLLMNDLVRERIA